MADGKAAGSRYSARPLMRILAVAQVKPFGAHVVERLRETRRSAVDVARGQPVRDGAVVGRGVRERPLHEPEAQRGRKLSAVFVEIGEHRIVVARVDDNADMHPVLRRRPHHRRAADVDVLDRVVQRAAGVRDSFAKRIKVDDDEIDRRDCMLRKRFAVRCDVAPPEDSRVDFRMQRLDSAVEHFGKSRVAADVGHVDALRGQELRRAARREQRYAARREAAREFHNAGLV